MYFYYIFLDVESSRVYFPELFKKMKTKNKKLKIFKMLGNRLD